jgi:hypothetical protein
VVAEVVVPWVAEEEAEDDNLLRFDLKNYTIKKAERKVFSLSLV